MRRLEGNDDTAWSQLYDAFALVCRGEISEAAFASVPHIERIANDLELADAFDHLELAGRVAYIGLCNCAWMAPDVLEPCLRAFRRLTTASFVIGSLRSAVPQRSWCIVTLADLNWHPQCWDSVLHVLAIWRKRKAPLRLERPV